jgi:hypothetical protein
MNRKPSSNKTAKSIIRKSSANTLGTRVSQSVPTSITQKEKTKILSNLFPAIDSIDIKHIDNTADLDTKTTTLETEIITKFRLKDSGQPENHFIFLVTILHILAYTDVTKTFLEKLSIILVYLEENAITGIYSYKNIDNQNLFIQPLQYFKIAKVYNQQIYPKYFTEGLEHKYDIVKNLTKEKAINGVTGALRNDIESSLHNAPDHPSVFFSAFNKIIPDYSFSFNIGANRNIIYISNTNILALVQNILERYIKTPGVETYTKYTLKGGLNGGSKRKFKTKNKTDNKSKQSKTKKPKAMKKSKYYDPNTKRYVKYETALKRNLIRK